MKTGSEVVVTLNHGEEAFQGKVLSSTPWTLRLRDFSVIDREGTHAAPGICRIRVAGVSWVQEL